MAYIHREHSVAANTLSLTDDEDTTGAFVMGQAAGGVLYCVDTGTEAAVALNFYLDPDDTGTKYLLTDEYNTPVEVTTEPGHCAALPLSLYGAGKVYPVVTTETTATVRIGMKT